MNDIEVSLQDTQDISTQVYDINYIPDYVKAEQERRENEIQRQANEAIRIANENTRIANEATRVSNESTRTSAESGRATAEQGRVSAESQRVINENARVTNESLRVDAEREREAYITELKQRVDNGEFNGQDGATGPQGIQGPQGSKGDKGDNATINGVNTLTIQEGENISITQSGSTMTISSTGGSGGTSDYTDLTNKPSINNVSLVGNKASNDLGLPYKKIVVQSSDEVIILDELEVGVYQILDKYNKPKTGFKYKRTSSFSGYYAISGVINGLFQIIKDVSTASNGDSIAYVETYYDPNNSNRKGYYSAEIYISGSSLGLSASGKIGSITTLDDTQIFTAKKTFNVLPESSVTPTTNNQLVNKKYVDDSIASAITDALEGEY